MKSYLSLVPIYAQAHRRRGRLTLVCIALAVALVTGIIGLADMAVQSLIAEQIRAGGNYHAIITDLPEAAAQEIADRPDVEVGGRLLYRDPATIAGEDFEVIAGEAAAAEAMGLRLTAGQYPTAADELIVDVSSTEQLGLALGDRLMVNTTDGGQKTYTLCGTFGDVNGLKTADSHGLFISAKALANFPAAGGADHFVLRFAPRTRIQKVLDEIRGSYQLTDQQVVPNNHLLGLMGQSRSSSLLPIYMAAVGLCLLVALATAMMIANAFNMTVAERTRFFGLLRCLGATKGQVRRFITREGLNFCLRGIPIGLLLGTLGIWLACLSLKYFNSEFFGEIPIFRLSAPGLAAGCLLGLLTVMLASRSPAKHAAAVSPQAAVTGGALDLKGGGRGKVATGRLPIDAALGLQHAFASPKNIILAAGSFALSIVLFLGFSVYIDLAHIVMPPLREGTPDISLGSEGPEALITPALITQVSELSDVETLSRHRDSGPLTGTYQGTAATLKLYSYDDQQFTWAEEAVTAGDIAAARRGEGVVVQYLEGDERRVGDFVTVTTPTGQQTLQIAAIVSEAPVQEKQGSLNLYVSEALFADLLGPGNYNRLDLQVQRDISPQLRELLPPEVKLYDRQQGNRDARSIAFTASVFVYGFLLVIGLVALMNILNTVSTSVQSHFNSYGIMRAVGMDIRQVKRMVSAEALTYALLGSLFGGVLGLLLHRCLFTEMITSSWGKVWHLPLGLLLATACLTIVTAIIAVRGPLKKLDRMEIVEVVSGE